MPFTLAKSIQALEETVMPLMAGRNTTNNVEEDDPSIPKVIVLLVCFVEEIDIVGKLFALD